LRRLVISPPPSINVEPIPVRDVAVDATAEPAVETHEPKEFLGSGAARINDDFPTDIPHDPSEAERTE
jgi:hypothetical protein